MGSGGGGAGPHLPGVGKHYGAGDRVPRPPRLSRGISGDAGLRSEPAEPLGLENPRSGGGELGVHQCQGPEVGTCSEAARQCVAVGGEALVLASLTRVVAAPRGPCADK